MVGVYVHFPWCRKRCPYCDFAVEVGPIDHDRYLDAVLTELAERSRRYSGELVSIYFGGGTPSLWRPDCIERVIAAVSRTFAGRAREITLEANPTDCTDAALAAWHTAGVTRVSIGIQSVFADELVVLGRDHRFGDGTTALARVLEHGGFTVSCDFIVGTPDQGRSSARNVNDLVWLDAIVASAVDHLSMYELTIEERTVFGKRAREKTLVPFDADALADLYLATHEVLTGAGFEHYEISSYARPGKRAIHNALYWRGAPILGLGVGAASLALNADGSGERATNPRRAADYMAAPGRAADVIAVSSAEMRADRAWLGMRTVDGAEEADFPSVVVPWLLDQGLAERRNARICPTLRGFLMADRIAARIAGAM